jgi:hypothetical protein
MLWYINISSNLALLYSSGSVQITRDTPVCDSWKRRVGQSWRTMDDLYNSDSDCEEPEARSYKVTASHSHTNFSGVFFTRCA